MSESQHLARSIEELFATPDSYWFLSYPAAVYGLTAEQAACAPGPRFNSVWGVTLHLIICQRFAAVLLRGEPVDAATFFAEGAWPPLRDSSAMAWEEAKTAVLEANRDLAAAVSACSPEALDAALPVVGMQAYDYIQGHLAHNSHHLNEMISIRHMLGLWLEKT
jgi:hypothetical protein